MPAEHAVQPAAARRFRGGRALADGLPRRRGRGTSIGNALAERLPDRVAAALAAYAGVDPAVAVRPTLARGPPGAGPRPDGTARCPSSQHRGWNYAEVTAGGVPLNEIDYRTMESRKVPGLHLAGEILDCDGRIGGFNFQWAWATGYLAGKAAGAG